MHIELAGAALDPWQALAAYQANRPELRGKYGATAVFVGTMRDFNLGDGVSAMILEHYPPMAQKYLEQVGREAAARWPVLDTLVIHRYGELRPDDPIVLVAAWSAHRGPAFDACRYIIDELKARAPFWKRELTAEGARWVPAHAGLADASKAHRPG